MTLVIKRDVIRISEHLVPRDASLEDGIKGINFSNGWIHDHQEVVSDFNKKNSTYFIATVDRRVQGFAIFRSVGLIKSGSSSVGYMPYLGVHKDSHRTGVGKELMLAVMQKARMIGVKVLNLSCNSEVLGFYEKIGEATQVNLEKKKIGKVTNGPDLYSLKFNFDLV